MVTSEYRLVLTQKDRDFINQILDPSGRQSQSLDFLLYDPGSVTSLLDDSRLYDAIMDCGYTVSISQHLYFYLILRREMVEHGISNPQLPEYVSWSLSDFVLDHPIGERNPGALHGHFLNAVDFVELVKSVDSYQKFMLELWAGNYYLIWAGVFHDFLERRERMHGAPGVRFYEKLGWSSFQFAQKHPLAHEFEMNGLLDEMVHEYFSLRRVLSRISDEILVWN